MLAIEGREDPVTGKMSTYSSPSVCEPARQQEEKEAASQTEELREAVANARLKEERRTSSKRQAKVSQRSKEIQDLALVQQYSLALGGDGWETMSAGIAEAGWKEGRRLTKDGTADIPSQARQVRLLLLISLMRAD